MRKSADYRFEMLKSDLDQMMVEESKAILERIKDYNPEERRLYLKGYFDSLQRFVDLDTDLFIHLVHNISLK